MKINGTFTVDLQPQTISSEGEQGVSLARMAINKTFLGELNASSVGEMLSARTATPGSAGYVAIEQVSGELCGKHGSFVLQHFGIMHQGDNRLILEVVPASGSDDLTGISGTMTIDIKEGQHYYEFDFSLD
ncbi:MAG: DUF3224 domain-containing protein [Gammaproteobacteria bacterium]|nr:DUF3224 domain-containing protein [Gammaproteobacteria bacterium]NVK86547.1 DUF3224 domain-containing protein [Gammaproteobacteria bacterium]